MLACRLLRWGSSTATDLKLDQTRPELYMDAVRNQHASQQQQADSLLLLPQPPASGDVVGHVAQPGLRHWASTDPDALPGVSAQPAEEPSLQHHQRHGLEKHLAVERSGSRIPVLMDDMGVPLTTLQSPQADVHRKAKLASRPQQTQPVPMSQGESQGSEQQTALPQVDPSHPSDLQPLQSATQPTQQDRQSQQPIIRQQPHADTLGDTGDLGGRSQPPQVLRQRPRSRLRLTQGGVVKGCLTLGKYRSGRVSPEKAALLPARQRSDVSFSSHQSYNDVGRVSSQTGMGGKVPGRHAKLKPFPSMRDMLSSTLQQVHACTAQLQQQSVQQQQLQRSVRAMTAKTTAMLDQAILAAVHAQQYADDLQQ